MRGSNLLEINKLCNFVSLLKNTLGLNLLSKSLSLYRIFIEATWTFSNFVQVFYPSKNAWYISPMFTVQRYPKHIHGRVKLNPIVFNVEVKESESISVLLPWTRRFISGTRRTIDNAELRKRFPTPERKVSLRNSFRNSTMAVVEIPQD